MFAKNFLGGNGIVGAQVFKIVVIFINFSVNIL
jgi:hypothetical protein